MKLHLMTKVTNNLLRNFGSWPWASFKPKLSCIPSGTTEFAISNGYKVCNLSTSAIAPMFRKLHVKIGQRAQFHA